MGENFHGDSHLVTFVANRVSVVVVASAERLRGFCFSVKGQLVRAKRATTIHGVITM